MSVVTAALNPCIDKTLHVDRVLPERKLQAHDVRCDPGGGGLNVARVLCELGGDVMARWSCGGQVGERLRQLLDGEGVPHEPVPIAGEIRENLIVGETSSRDQYRFSMPGPELSDAERSDWLERLRGLSPAPRYLVLSGSLPGEGAEAWLRELVRAVPEATRVVVDTKRAALASALEEGVHLAKPNVHELAELAGRELPGEEEIEGAARELVERGGAQVVVVSLGPGGALWVDADACLRVPAPTVAVRSRIGAGDSMVAGLVLALDQESPSRDALLFGVAAGAAAVTTRGTALCRRADVERLYETLQKTRGTA